VTSIVFDTFNGFDFFIRVIRVEGDDNNYASETETYLEDQTTRYYLHYLPCCRYLCLYFCSEPSPVVGEKNVGNRDDELRKTYRGLANLRHVAINPKPFVFVNNMCFTGGLVCCPGRTGQRCCCASPELFATSPE